VAHGNEARAAREVHLFARAAEQMMGEMGTATAAKSLPAWHRRDLRRPSTLLAAIVAFCLSAPAAIVVSCNVHEIGHALVATPLGWEVERINLCLPFGGSVEYARIGTWAGNLQGYAGGFIAAAFLMSFYAFALARPRRPLRGPTWWAAGLGIVIWVGPQMLIGILEGVAAPGHSYADDFRDAPALYGLVVVSVLSGALFHVWLWRSVLRSLGD